VSPFSRSYEASPPWKTCRRFLRGAVVGVKDGESPSCSLSLACEAVALPGIFWFARGERQYKDTVSSVSWSIALCAAVGRWGDSAPEVTDMKSGNLGFPILVILGARVGGRGKLATEGRKQGVFGVRTPRPPGTPHPCNPVCFHVTRGADPVT
jgi:hypothetical protein